MKTKLKNKYKKQTKKKIIQKKKRKRKPNENVRRRRLLRKITLERNLKKLRENSERQKVEQRYEICILYYIYLTKKKMIKNCNAGVTSMQLDIFFFFGNLYNYIQEKQDNSNRQTDRQTRTHRQLHTHRYTEI